MRSGLQRGRGSLSEENSRRLAHHGEHDLPKAGRRRGMGDRPQICDIHSEVHKLDSFNLLVIDDPGYLPQEASESEVLFNLIAERYERRSLGITSKLVFSKWEKVFSNVHVDCRDDRRAGFQPP